VQVLGTGMSDYLQAYDPVGPTVATIQQSRTFFLLVTMRSMTTGSPVFFSKHTVKPCIDVSIFS